MGMPISLWQWLLPRGNITVFHKLFLKDLGLFSLYLGLYAWRIRVRYHEPAEWIGTDSVKKFRFQLHTYTRKQRFEKVPLWRAFSKSSVFIDRFHRIRKERVAYSNQNGYLWTGPELAGLFMKMTRQYLSDWIKSKHCNSSQNHWLKTYSW